MQKFTMLQIRQIQAFNHGVFDVMFLQLIFLLHQSVIDADSNAPNSPKVVYKGYVF